jgi:hypothetical protein
MAGLTRQAYAAKFVLDFLIEERRETVPARKNQSPSFFWAATETLR